MATEDDLPTASGATPASFPEVLDPTVPPDTESLSLGAGRIRNLSRLVGDVLGLPTAPTNIVAPAFHTTAQGVVTIAQPGAAVVADPTVPLGIATKQYADGSFLNFRAIASGQNAYAITLPAQQAAQVNAGSVPFAVGFPVGNTGACTLSVNGGPAHQIVRPEPYGLVPYDIIGGQWIWLVFDGSWWTMVGGNFFPMTGGVVQGSGIIEASQLLSWAGPNTLTGVTYTNTVDANAINTGTLSASGTIYAASTISTSGNFYAAGGGTNTFAGSTNLYYTTIYTELVTAGGVPTVFYGPVWGENAIYTVEPSQPSQVATKNYFDTRIPVVASGSLAAAVGIPAGWVYLMGAAIPITPPFYAIAYAFVTGIISVSLAGYATGGANLQYGIWFNGAPAFYSVPITIILTGTMQIPFNWVAGLGGASATFQIYIQLIGGLPYLAATAVGPSFIEVMGIGH